MGKLVLFYTCICSKKILKLFHFPPIFCGVCRRLSLYPNGNKKNNGIGFISLYLQIEETENFPRTWEVNVNFRFFVLDQLRDKYLTIEGIFFFYINFFGIIIFLIFEILLLLFFYYNQFDLYHFILN